MVRQISNENELPSSIWKKDDSNWTVVQPKKKKPLNPSFKDTKNLTGLDRSETPLTKIKVLDKKTTSFTNKSEINKNYGKPTTANNNEFPSLSQNPTKSAPVMKTSLWAQKVASKQSSSIGNSRGERPTKPMHVIRREKPVIEDKKEPQIAHSKPSTEEESKDKFVEPRFVYDINCVVFVGNVASTTTQDMLSRFFSQFGLVKSVNLKNAVTGRNRRDYAFIKFLTPDSVTKVLNSKEPLVLDGATLEVRPRAGSTSTSTLPKTANKNTQMTVDNGFKTILVENIPESWSPQFFFQCFCSYGKPISCFVYDGVDNKGTKQGLIEMETSAAASSLCKNTGYLLLPNNTTVKVTLTSIPNFSEWVKMHTQWLIYHQMANMKYNLPQMAYKNPLVPKSEVSNSTEKKEKNDVSVEKPRAISSIVKASNVDIKSFKNSDEVFTTFRNIFGHAYTPAIVSISSEGKAIVIFKVPDLNEAKNANKVFDWTTFPGSVPEIAFT